MKLGNIIGLGVLGLGLTVTPAQRLYADGGDATLIHGCVAKDGTTRIVSPSTNCKSSETARHWPTDARIIADEARIINTEAKNTTQDSQISAIQTKNSQQDAAITTLQGQVGGASGGLVVKDSFGQVVGKLFDKNNMSVIRQVGNVALELFVRPTGFNDGVPQFYYTTNNCSGTRLRESYQSFGFFK